MRALLVVVLVVGLRAGTAGADYAETEQRLKGAGVDPALRARIHKAIDGAVDYLVSQQRPKGSFHSRTYMAHPIGATALAGLALRHAGTRRAKAAAAKALRFVARADGKGRSEVRTRTYDAGIMAMFLMPDRAHPALAAHIARALSASQGTYNGWWGYALAENGSTRGVAANLSTTQFAALGLWAAARNGARVPRQVWRTHLESLIRTQAKDGSWAYYQVAGRKIAGYPTGTMMGAANFALAEQAMGEALRNDKKLYRQVLAARLRMLDAVRRDGKRILQGNALPVVSQAFDFYALYALEKACLFLGLERLGDTYWYREGARDLLAVQNKDGGWGNPRIRSAPRTQFRRSDVVDTAFGLLFLLRSSATYRPVTPRPVDHRPVTGTPKPAK